MQHPNYKVVATLDGKETLSMARRESREFFVVDADLGELLGGPYATETKAYREKLVFQRSFYEEKHENLSKFWHRSMSEYNAMCEMFLLLASEIEDSEVQCTAELLMQDWERNEEWLKEKLEKMRVSLKDKNEDEESA